jgi:hypothetical protein
MKQQIKKWLLRLTVTSIVIASILIAIVLKPTFTYANKTIQGNFTIYHNAPLEPAFTQCLSQVALLMQHSEYYNPKLKLDICLNDGSLYPKLIRAIRGQAFAWGFYNKVVLQGNLQAASNYVQLNGYKWNLIQLLTHEITHCMQFNKLGLWHSNPIAGIDNWKWEGYAEYVARQYDNQQNLASNIYKLHTTAPNAWSVTFNNGTIAPQEYYKAWLLVQYYLNVKGFTYTQLLSDTASEASVTQQMMAWYNNEHLNNKK